MHTAIVEIVLKLRGLLWMNYYAQRLECVQLAGAVVRCEPVLKREQAPRTPNGSRGSMMRSAVADSQGLSAFARRLWYH